MCGETYEDLAMLDPLLDPFIDPAWRNAYMEAKARQMGAHLDRAIVADVVHRALYGPDAVYDVNGRLPRFMGIPVITDSSLPERFIKVVSV